MLTSKQRAFLRSMAANADTILMIGKGGVSDEVIAQQKLIDRNPIRNLYSFDSTPALLNGDLIAESQSLNRTAQISAGIQREGLLYSDVFPSLPPEFDMTSASFEPFFD